MYGPELMMAGRSARPVQLRDQVQPQRHLVAAVMTLHSELGTYSDNIADIFIDLRQVLHITLWPVIA